MSYRVPIYKLRLVRAHTASFPERVIHQPRQAAEFFSKLIGKADREHLAVLFLDAQNVPSGSTIVGIGTLTQASAHCREVFKAAILANAHSIVIAHNHPSGNVEPSESDLRTARRLGKAGGLLGIPVADQIIVGGKGGAYSSFCELGLMGEGSWLPIDVPRIS